MEIKITFSTIIGILMVVIVTLAAIAILSSLTKVSIFYNDTSSTSLCSVYTVFGDCTSDGCYWCPQCSGYKVNLWRKDKCVGSDADCVYACYNGYCGAPYKCDKCYSWHPDTCECLPHGGYGC
jgi:hypothetical protein